MTTTQISPNARPNTVAAITERDGHRIGHVVNRGRTFTASRKTGSSSDLRRYATGFKTLAAAVKFVEAAA